MKSTYKSREDNVIIKQLVKNNFSKQDLCRMLNISLPTLNNWIYEPGMIRLRELTLMAGMFGINVLEFVYLLERTKPVLRKVDKWYIESLKLDSDTKKDI